MNYTIDARENIIPLEQMDLKQVRDLWKECFQDTEAYMDFYYSWKTKDNVIFGLYDEKRLISMLHLNPYQLSINGAKANSYYIVGVATDEAYRKRGLMRKLLSAAMRQMYAEQVPFTYLMPAKEAIYLPFDFRIVTVQKRMSIPLHEVRGRYEEPEVVAASVKLRTAAADMEPEVVSDIWSGDTKANRKLQGKKSESVDSAEAHHGNQPQIKAFLVDSRQITQLEELSQYANHKLARENEIYTVRSSAYYERMIAELKVSNGAILAIEEGGEITGYSAFVLEDGKLEVVEFLCEDRVRDELLQQMYSEVMERLTKQKIAVNSEATPSQAPPIMARIIHAKQFFQELRATEQTTITIRVLDPLIVENNAIFTIDCNEEVCSVAKAQVDAYNELGIDLVCNIADLTRLFFGQMSGAELMCLIPEQKEEVKEKLKKLNYYCNIHINEIV